MRSMFASARLRSKHASSRASSSAAAHLGIGGEQLAERALLLPRLHRVALHDPVRLVAARARLDEREQHRLAEHEPERRVEVAQHPLGIHAQALDDLRELHEHVVREHERVGNDDALDRRVRDVALVPQRDVFERGLQVAAQHAREPAQLLRLDRVALVRHRARALLLALAERLLGLAHLGALQVTDLERERLDARADRRARVQHLGVAIARQHLRGGHRRAGRGARTRSARPRDRRWSTCRPRPRACRPRSSRGPARAARGRGAPASPRARASCRTSSARRGCRACGRPSACRGTRGPAPRSPSRAARRAGEDAIERARHLERERGVDDVARREPVVHPRARGLARRSPARRRRTRRRRDR